MTNHAPVPVVLRQLRGLALAAPLLVAPLLAGGCRRERDHQANGEVTRAAPPPAAPDPAAPTAQPPTPSTSPRTSARAPRAAPPAATGRCTVKSVHDGDTMRCTDDRRVRLLLIDAPELDQRPFGERARTALRALLPVGTTVRYETDVQRQDRYRRTLAYVYLPDGRMANEEMVRQGYAVPLVYRPNVKYEARVQGAAVLARRERRGLHADSGFACAPREHRRRAC